MLPFFDTHTHLTDEDTDLQAYYRRAAEQNVKYLLICSSGKENSLRSAEFAGAFPNVWFAAGLHPEDLEGKTPDCIGEYAEFASHRHFAAVGEIGLDYYYESSAAETQIRFFSGFLDLALALNVPAVIHCRDKQDSEQAYMDAERILKPFSAKGGTFVLHAFAGTRAWAERFADLGAYFGVGGMITFKKADNIRDTVSVISPDRLLLETDSPYLAPVPFRGKVNHPAYLPYSAEMLASVKNMSVSEIREKTTENASRLFRLNLKSEE